jgi:hypothetical protein
MNTAARFLILAALALGLLRPVSAATTSGQPDLLTSYVKIQAALAADDLKAAQSAASDLSTQAAAAKQQDVAAKATAVAKAGKIADARKEFKALSTAVEPLAEKRDDLVVMHCPMANADWVQAKGSVANPYYGKMMLTCGAPKNAK